MTASQPAAQSARLFSQPRRAQPNEDSDSPKRNALLALGALGVVFGDIGTSPLYALQTVFSIEHNAVEPNPIDVYGVISLVFWSVLIVVTLKYVLLVMRADNEGEGGILALVALLQRRLRGKTRMAATVTVMGIMGAALFYGDSVITPAISMMSAIEGLTIVTPEAEAWVLPASVVILTLLFASQRFGTELVGRAFGPIMLVWFSLLAVLGVPQIVAHPQILAAVSPTYALDFAVERPHIAFISMGAVVLCITGAEALYADMGHFGRKPIKVSWFSIVLPSLLLNYFGQGAMILTDPSTVASPFFRLAPSWATIPLVVLATLATVIASQAVISGAFSVTRQAIRLRLLPRMAVKHTSKEEGGQIYISAINWMLYVGVLVLVFVFGSSTKLATAYGLAVTGTLILTTILFLFLARNVWRWATWRLILVGLVVGGIELVYFAANLTKIPSGGWLPLVIAGTLVTLMLVWRAGYKARREARARLEGPLSVFVLEVRRCALPRVPGVAIYPHSNASTVPLALRHNLEFNKVLHEKVVIVTVVNENVPHIRHVDRVSINDLGYVDDGIVSLRYRVGFNDSQNIPAAIELGIGQSPEMIFDPAQACYFLSALHLKAKPGPWWRKLSSSLFLWMARREANRGIAFHIPMERSVVFGARAQL